MKVSATNKQTLKAIIDNINDVVNKVQKLYNVLDMNLQSNDDDLIEMYAQTRSKISILYTLSKLNHYETDYYVFSKLDDKLIDVLIEDLNQAQMSIQYLINNNQ